MLDSEQTRLRLASPSLPSYRIVVLGAGRGVRHAMPSAVVRVDPTSRVLDWQLNAFSGLDDADAAFVGGYMADAVIEQYPDIRFWYNAAWQTTGPVKSIAMAPLSSLKATFVCYSDVLFRGTTVEALEQVDADLVLAVDSQWRVRYEGRADAELDLAEKIRFDQDRLIDIGKHIDNAAADGEYVGLMKLTPRAVAAVWQLIRSGQVDDAAGLPELIARLLAFDLSAHVVDVSGDWAELNAPQDLARFVLGTKAESLERLKPLVRKSHIGDLVAFTHREWSADAAAVIRRIRDVFGDAELIARSSALSEDNWLQSSAGAYDSVPSLPSTDTLALTGGIEKVLRSYGKPVPENQVLVQQMLSDVTMSGVVMTRTPSLLAPYYVINFDNTTRRTDTVTAGNGKNIRTLFLHRDAALRNGLPPELYQLAEVVGELETLVGHDSLDIEFAFTADRRAHVLQVRPIAVSHVDDFVDDQQVAVGLKDAQRYFAQLQTPAPFLLGNSTQLSVMSDWNPAEIIGVKPKRLSLSLYRYLITDAIWAQQRSEFGYRDVRPCNLIVDLLGQPYVDVRATFNSFLPADLPEELAEKLVEHYLDYLKRHPQLHDKVEFEVLFTCLTFDFDQRAKRLRDAGFRAEEVEQLRESLRKITFDGIARIHRDAQDIETLQQRFEVIRQNQLPPLEKAYVYLEDAKKYGTLAFAHLARAGFVAVSLLRSLVTVQAITSREMEDFLASVTTVSGDLQCDAYRVASGKLAWEQFVETYGHLRPGTYDITSPSYGSAPEEFLRPMVTQAKLSEKPPAKVWSAATRDRVSAQLDRAGLDLTSAELEDFMRRAIRMREYGKFIFTKNLSASLDCLAEFGHQHNVAETELAHVRIEDLLACRAARVEDTGTALRSMAARGEEAFLVSQAVCLPGQIFSAEDLTCFEQIESEPNYVTRKSVRAAVAAPSLRASPEQDLEGKIVLIPSADPGFDWIFTRNIAGLITMYGGANSHMTIRAAEFELPAAIGVGSLAFEELITAHVIELDCASRHIHVVR